MPGALLGLESAELPAAVVLGRRGVPLQLPTPGLYGSGLPGRLQVPRESGEPREAEMGQRARQACHRASIVTCALHAMMSACTSSRVAGERTHLGL